jgi:hypothetical protein
MAITREPVWHATLRRAGVSYFRIYDLRSIYATRLSAGCAADEWVMQLSHSWPRAEMKRQALVKLKRQRFDWSGRKDLNLLADSDCRSEF